MYILYPDVGGTGGEWVFDLTMLKCYDKIIEGKIFCFFGVEYPTEDLESQHYKNRR
jgi:hypothetical protein